MNLDIYLLTTSDEQYPLLQQTFILHSDCLGARKQGLLVSRVLRVRFSQLD